MDWLDRIRSEPATAPAGYQPPQLLHSPITPRTAAKTQDPNAPDYRYQVNQKCVYERELPGGSYITAHIQRLQSGYYDSPVVHEDLVENVRFIAINFVFHPSRKDYRFKSADISIAIHHTSRDGLTPLNRVRNSIGVDSHNSDHDHATQTDTVSHALVRSKEYLPPPRRKTKPATIRPRFIRHAPHLLFGTVSPETLDWNFNLAGSIGVSQGPASAAFKPSYGTKGSYKVYEMMRIQGSVRTLRSWHGHEYDVEDGEIMWTLEENPLQKSGLPREFTFVMLLTKGSGGIEPSDDITLDIDVHPKVSGPLGGTYPKFVTGLPSYQPFRKDPVNLDEEIGQVFEPSIRERGFNFANLACNFDDFVWLPGTTYSTLEMQQQQQQHQQQPSGTAAAQAQGRPQLTQQPQRSPSQSQQPRKQLTSQPSAETTLQLRVILENARGSPVPITNGNLQHNVLPYLHLKAPSRGPSPLPPSVAGSHRSKRSKRSITIKSQAPSSYPAQSQRKRHTYADPHSHSHSRHVSGGSATSQPQNRQSSHTHSLRKTRSRSGLDKEFIRSESPAEVREVQNQNQNQSQMFHDAKTGISPPSTATVEREAQPLPRAIDGEDDALQRTENSTIKYSDEAERQKDGEEHEPSRSEEHFEDMRQIAIGRLALPHELEHEADLTPASRYGRFPSLSHTYSRAAQDPTTTQAYEQTGPSAQTPPRTPPRAAPEQPLPPSPLVETEQSRQLELDQEDQQQQEPEEEEEAEPTTPPQAQARSFEPVTPTGSSQGLAQDSPREPTLSPGTMLDPLTPPSQRKYQPDSEPSTPPWQQQSSSLSPPSIPTTSSKARPANATPRFQQPQHGSPDAVPASTTQSYDQPEQGTWTDTIPEQPSPSGSALNTPTRNQSLRTRHATARALELQDQLSPLPQGSKAPPRASEEHHRTPKITVPARGHSLRIQAGPQAREGPQSPARAYDSLPSQQGRPRNTSSSSPAATAQTASASASPSASAARAAWYKYPAVPRSGAVATGIPSQARAQTYTTTTHSRSSNSSRPQSKDGKQHSPIVKKPEKGGAFNYTQMLLQEPELDFDAEGDSPPEYADASRRSHSRSYTREQERQLREMERDAIDMQREAMARRAALSSSDPALSSPQSSEAAADTTPAAAPKAGLSTHMAVTSPVEMDSPTLPTHARTSRDSPRTREMPPVTKVFSTPDTRSGSEDTNNRPRKLRRRSTKESPSSNNSNSNSNRKGSKSSRRESWSLIAKAQKYMRDAGYGSRSDSREEQAAPEQGQGQVERSFEPPAGRGPLPGDRKAHAGDTRALGVSGFIPAAENPRVHDFDRQEREALSGFMRAEAGDAHQSPAAVQAEEHEKGLVSPVQDDGRHDDGQDEQDNEDEEQVEGRRYDHETSRYDQETPRDEHEQDNSSGRYELDTTPVRETTRVIAEEEEEYCDDEHEALLGTRESQASFVSSNKDWRNTAGYATNMI